jgi:hypothetical protein
VEQTLKGKYLRPYLLFLYVFTQKMHNKHYFHLHCANSKRFILLYLPRWRNHNSTQANSRRGKQPTNHCFKNCLPAIFFLFASFGPQRKGPRAPSAKLQSKHTPGGEFCADLIIFITLMQQQRLLFLLSRL